MNVDYFFSSAFFTGTPQPPLPLQEFFPPQPLSSCVPHWPGKLAHVLGTQHADHTPTIPPGCRHVILRFTGAQGRADLQWDLAPASAGPGGG